MVAKKKKYYKGMTFRVGNVKLKIGDIYASSTWKHDFVWVYVWRNNQWEKYKFIEVNKLYKYFEKTLDKR